MYSMSLTVNDTQVMRVSSDDKLLRFSSLELVIFLNRYKTSELNSIILWTLRNIKLAKKSISDVLKK